MTADLPEAFQPVGALPYTETAMGFLLGQLLSAGYTIDQLRHLVRQLAAVVEALHA